MLTESLCVLHLQVNLARLLNGLGDTSLLHPDDSALGITVQRSELYDSLMLELRQEKEKNDQLRADLKKRCIDDRSVQGAIEPVRTELEMQHRDDLKSKLAGQSHEHRQHMQRAREQHDLALQNALQKLRQEHSTELDRLGQKHETRLRKERQELLVQHSAQLQQHQHEVQDLAQQKKNLDHERCQLNERLQQRDARIVALESQITALTQERDALRLQCQRAESWSPPSFTELCSHGKAGGRENIMKSS